MTARPLSPLRRRFEAATACALLAAFVPAAVAIPRVAHAQSADDPVTKAARARFQEGVAEFDKGNFEAARAAFLEAYALKQHPAVLLNLAQSCLKSGHYLEAAKDFQKYLNDPQGDKKADASKGLADARAKLGRLDVTAPPGSEVTVDADTVGKTPLNEAVDVEAGNHTVRARLPDGTSSEQKVVVTAGQLQPVHFGAAATVVAPPTNPNPNPTTNPENPNPPANPPTNPTPENPQPGTPTPTTPSERVHPTAGLAIGIGGGVVAVAGFVLAGTFAALKSQANSNYKSVQDNIVSSAQKDGYNPNGLCNSPPNATYQQKCSALKTNIDAVNQDATAANAFLVVGIIGAVAAIGGFVWWGIGQNKSPQSAHITPWIAPGTGGLTLSGSF